MAIISVTRLRLRSLWYLPGFILWARRTARQARKAEGNLGVGLLKDARLAFWTKTAWKDEDSMRLYKYSEPHRMDPW